MATEAGDIHDYDPVIRNVILGEAVRVIRAFGFAGTHVVVIGGLVPSLLVPSPEPHVKAHVGTMDLDLCLNLAIVDGRVGAYERLEKSLRKLGFTPLHGESWRWRGGVSLPLVIEFFCPAAPGRDAGRLHRPGGVVGGKLSAMVLEAGAAIDRDAVTVEIEAALPGESGRTRHALRVAGPAGFLIAKARALVGRDRNKSVDSAGAVKYARFLSGDAAERERLFRHAVGAVRVLLEELGSA